MPSPEFVAGGGGVRPNLPVTGVDLDHDKPTVRATDQLFADGLRKEFFATAGDLLRIVFRVVLPVQGIASILRRSHGDHGRGT